MTEREPSILNMVVRAGWGLGWGISGGGRSGVSRVPPGGMQESLQGP